MRSRQWTTADITRNYSLAVFDTLYAYNAQFSEMQSREQWAENVRLICELQHFIERGHACVTRGAHGQGAVGGGKFDRNRCRLIREQAVDQAGGKGVAASNSIQNREIRIIP